ncbi:MAG: septum formation initiator family protein [Gemmatimonadota bacterium]
MTGARWLAVAVLILMAVFAWQGGIFGTSAYREMERQAEASRREAARLEREVDSLRAFADSLEHDPAVQERVARENFGMLRPGELSFTIVPAPTTKQDSTPR